MAAPAESGETREEEEEGPSAKHTHTEGPQLTNKQHVHRHLYPELLWPITVAYIRLIIERSGSKENKQ